MSNDEDWIVECLRSIDLGGPQIRLMVRKWRVVGNDERPPPSTYWFELDHADGVDRADSLGHLAVARCGGRRYRPVPISVVAGRSGPRGPR